MVFERKIYDKMLEWKEVSHGKTAMFLEGARRVGKSTAAEEFAKAQYDDYMILDFMIEKENVKNLFFEYLGDLDEFFRRLFTLKRKTLKPGCAVIIFDEIQLFPQARAAMKYLVADGRFDYIETGSLISIKRKRNNVEILNPSEEYKIKMFPMDFEEFLWACGDRVTYDVIRDAFAGRKPLGEEVHREIMKRFREYMVIGGMPQAVACFTEGGTYKEIDFIKCSILDLYEEDLRKYDEDNKVRASVIFSSIPEQLHNHNSHFKFSLIDKNARYRDYVEAVGFVGDSMIGNICLGVTMPAVDLESYADKSDFKLYMGDTGLLISQMIRIDESDRDEIYEALLFDKLSIDYGFVMENIVAQMLRAGGHGLYYHGFKFAGDGRREKIYEIDFLTVKKRRICPIEVKSSNYRRHKSFDNFRAKYSNIKVTDRYVVYTRDLRFEDDICYVPIYMAGLI